MEDKVLVDFSQMSSIHRFLYVSRARQSLIFLSNATERHFRPTCITTSAQRILTKGRIAVLSTLAAAIGSLRP